MSIGSHATMRGFKVGQKVAYFNGAFRLGHGVYTHGKILKFNYRHHEALVRWEGAKKGEDTSWIAITDLLFDTREKES